MSKRAVPPFLFPFFVFTYRFTHYKRLTTQPIPEQGCENGQIFSKVTQTVSSRNRHAASPRRRLNQIGRLVCLSDGTLGPRPLARAIKSHSTTSGHRRLEMIRKHYSKHGKSRKKNLEANRFSAPDSPEALNSAGRKPDPPPSVSSNHHHTSKRRSFPSSVIIIKKKKKLNRTW